MFLRYAIELKNKTEHSLLVFSGGQTRKTAGPISEAASYYLMSSALYKNEPAMYKNIVLEEFARDSFENVLFSICRFKEFTGRYPLSISVIGFDFKGERFMDIIRHALQFPIDSFNYFGLKPDTSLGFDYDRAASGEQSVLLSLRRDMYACATVDLIEKREIRNPFRRTIPYVLSCPELEDLLNWCGPQIFPGLLPWVK